MSYSLRVRVVRLSSFPNSASAEMSVSYSLVSLMLEWIAIQLEGKGGKVAQFPQFHKCRDFRELLIPIMLAAFFS
jgi:hypothetical protein